MDWAGIGQRGLFIVFKIFYSFDDAHYSDEEEAFDDVDEAMVGINLYSTCCMILKYMQVEFGCFFSLLK